MSDKLKELHDSIKLHPFRLEFEEKYKKDYLYLLETLGNEFSEEIRKTKYKDSYKILHDFREDICSIYYNRSNDFSNIERCLGIIHLFINTAELSEYCTYYNGPNILQSQSRFTKYLFDEATSKYIPQFSKEEIINCIAEIETFYKEAFGENKDQWKWHRCDRYSKFQYEYFTDYLIRFYSDR